MFSRSTPIFSLFLKAVYPVVMTEVQLCFMRKIAYNSFIFIGLIIYPKFDTSVHLYTLMHVPNFSQIEAHIHKS